MHHQTIASPNKEIAQTVTKPLSVENVIGRALPYIGAYKQLDNSKQVVALIDDVSKVFSD